MDELATALASASLAAWLWLLVGRGGFWRCSEILGTVDREPAHWPQVVAVIPARNEARVIGACLGSLARQDYPAAFSVVVVDDASDDDTAGAARAVDGLRNRIEIVSGAPLAAGWTGKMWALDQGVTRAAAAYPDAEFIWFTDADITHDPDVLRRLVIRAELDCLDMVSTMVLLNCRAMWERLLIPAFVFFFQKLYPFPWVNDPRRAMAAAAGGSVLIRRRALARIGGIAAIRNELIDDCALARAVKRDGKIWLGLTDASRSLRDYASLGEIWSMVTRTAFHQLRYSILLLTGSVLVMALIYLVPAGVILTWPLHGDGMALVFAALAFLAMMAAYAPTLLLYRQGVAHRVLLPAAALCYTAMMLDSARRHWLGRGGTWKSRNYTKDR
jgi:hopene-associated glycosyltransferase HpnB